MKIFDFLEEKNHSFPMSPHILPLLISLIATIKKDLSSLRRNDHDKSKGAIGGKSDYMRKSWIHWIPFKGLDRSRLIKIVFYSHIAMTSVWNHFVFFWKSRMQLLSMIFFYLVNNEFQISNTDKICYCEYDYLDAGSLLWCFKGWPKMFI